MKSKKTKIVNYQGGKIVIFKKFSELNELELNKIINKHYNHWVQYSPTMDLNTTKDKFKNIYAKDDNIPFGIAMFKKDELIGFLVFKYNCLEKYPQYTPWISDVMIFDEYRNQGYGKKMIEVALATLKELGYEKAYLWTDQVPAFYEKIGFNYEHEVEKNEGGTGRLYSKEIK